MKKVSAKTKNKNEAQKFLLSFEKIQTERNKNWFFTLSSLRDFVLDYIKNNFTKSTHQLYKRAFREFIDILGNKIAYDVTPEDIEYFKRKCLDTPSI